MLPATTMARDEHDPPNTLEARIITATKHVEDAERDLEALLSELEKSDRSQKVMVGDTLRAALEQLAETRRKLEAARKTGT